MEREYRITSVELAAGQRDNYHIYVDGAHAFTVHEDVLVKHRLLKGETLSERSMAEIAREAERLKAYHDALAYIARRPRASKEIRQHLRRKKYPVEWVDDALRKLEAGGHVDDKEFAKKLTSHRIHQQRKGSRWVRQELLQKGIKPAEVNHALQSIDEDAEYRAASELARKRWKPEADAVVAAKSKTKLIQFLLRRGYPMGTVQRVVREVTKEPLGDIEFVDE